MPHIQQPRCPNCQSEMKLTRIETLSARITSGPPNYGIRTFEGPRCPRILRKAVRLEDPMKTKTTTDWLRGQLVRPNYQFGSTPSQNITQAAIVPS
jgi:hypothetical protein